MLVPHIDRAPSPLYDRPSLVRNPTQTRRGVRLIRLNELYASIRTVPHGKRFNKTENHTFPSELPPTVARRATLYKVGGRATNSTPATGWRVTIGTPDEKF